MILSLPLRFAADYLMLSTLHYGNSEHLDFFGTISVSCNIIVAIAEHVPG